MGEHLERMKQLLVERTPELNLDRCSVWDLIIHIERERGINDATARNEDVEDLAIEALDELYHKGRKLHVGDCPMTNTGAQHSEDSVCVCEHHDHERTYIEGGGGEQATVEGRLAAAVQSLLHLRSPHTTMYEGKAARIENEARLALAEHFARQERYFSQEP